MDDSTTFKKKLRNQNNGAEKDDAYAQKLEELQSNVPRLEKSLKRNVKFTYQIFNRKKRRFISSLK